MTGRLSSELLGFGPADRVLLVNADDLGMHPAINEAVFAGLADGIVRSTSLMTVCPGTEQALAMLRRRADTPAGVHLTLVRDRPGDDWRPTAPVERVASLVDATGRFPEQTSPSWSVRDLRIEHVEIEFRAQLASVLRTEVRPTHLDFHCLADGGRHDILDVATGLAAEHGLAVRIWLEPGLGRARAAGLPVVDHPFLDSFGIRPGGKADHYERLLRELPAGLTEWAVHPAVRGTGTAEASGSRVRTGDHDFLVSPRARRVIDEEGIELIGYDALQPVWRRRRDGVQRRAAAGRPQSRP
ncbi:carbohydrate deacetylase [Pseudonocardia kongjuensis]|uniref:Carbohydrate deacetylase n=1 Tax=Pseudonocardia kongjuensis TaxID=102227 RepID=A0ABN1XME2_9PSEU